METEEACIESWISPEPWSMADCPNDITADSLRIGNFDFNKLKQI